MGNFDRLESGKWSEAANTLVGKLEAEGDKILAEDAARGFPAPTGDSLETLMEAGQEVKMKLVEAGGKLYTDQRQVIFEQDEFALKILTKIAKLSLELYRERLFNALAMEQALAAEKEERESSDVDRENAETEARQVVIIRAKAEIEQSILVYKQQLIGEQYQTMAGERVLIEAQLETARKKLEIINSIYQVLAAEQLVLAAENRRAAALQIVLEEERTLAEIKKGMVPLYLQKAQVEKDLAAATIAEIPALAGLAGLGNLRAAVKGAEAGAEAAMGGAEAAYQGAVQAYVTAEAAFQVAKEAAHLLILTYNNTVGGEIEALKTALEADSVALRIESQLGHEMNRAAAETYMYNLQQTDLQKELEKILATLTARGADAAATIRASANQVLLSASTTTTNATSLINQLRIQKG